MYYYWDDKTTNNLGEHLHQCVEKYGLGTQKLRGKYTTMTVIYLDDQKSFGNSWCLKVIRKGKNIPMTLYEENKMYGPCPYEATPIKPRKISQQEKMNTVFKL